jgi:hypothetical protein
VVGDILPDEELLADKEVMTVGHPIGTENQSSFGSPRCCIRPCSGHWSSLVCACVACAAARAPNLPAQSLVAVTGSCFLVGDAVLRRSRCRTRCPLIASLAVSDTLCRAAIVVAKTQTQALRAVPLVKVEYKASAFVALLLPCFVGSVAASARCCCAHLPLLCSPTHPALASALRFRGWL